MTAVDSNLSALRAFGTKMAVTANNIANMQSEGFKKSRVVLNEGSRGDVEVQIDRVDTPGHRVVEIEGGVSQEKELSNVELEEEIVATIQAQRGHEANLKSIQTQEEMLGAVLDIIG